MTWSTSSGFEFVTTINGTAYPTGETVTPGYSATGWLTGLTTSAGGTTALASNLSYGGLAGAGGQISSMSLGNGAYTYSASYDTGLRLTSSGLKNTSSGAQLYQTQPTYDAVSNIIGVQTSVGSQTDNQQFCYDDLNRLTWAGANGTPPCSGASITAGTLTGAQYQQSNAYNIDGGLTTGPKGSYTYGDSTHPHAVTATSAGYSAAYDASGNMSCRAVSTSTTCSGPSPTGQQLSYDAEGRLTTWQDQSTLPGQTVNYLYDGEGHRVAMQSNVSGTSTLTAYIGSIEEVQTGGGSSTQTTTYYTVGSKRVAADVNGTFYYFGYDALGSQVAVLNATGSLVGAQLYGPYGASRYTTGTIPTSIGFTGQRADSVTGLDYYVARYYDPVVGVFLSADSVQGNMQGMEPYAYVGGNPETMTDPTGNWAWGLAAALLPLAAVAVGAVALGAIVVSLSVVAAPIILGAAIGVAAAGIGSLVTYSILNGHAPWQNDQEFDDWGKQTLLGEALGGIFGGLSVWASMGISSAFAVAQPQSTADAINWVGSSLGSAVGATGSSTIGSGIQAYAAKHDSSTTPSSHSSKKVFGLKSKSAPAPRRTAVPIAHHYKSKSYAVYTTPTSNWTSSYINDASWQNSLWNTWTHTAQDTSQSAWITYQGEQDTHYVREVAAERNGGY